MALEQEAGVGQTPAPADGVERGHVGLAAVEQLQEAAIVLERTFRPGQTGPGHACERDGPARGLADEKGLAVGSEHRLAATGGGCREAQRAGHRVLVQLQQAAGGGGRTREPEGHRAPPAPKVVVVGTEFGQHAGDLRARDEGASERAGVGSQILCDGHGGRQHHRRSVHDAGIRRVVDIPDMRRHAVDQRCGLRIRPPARPPGSPFPASGAWPPPAREPTDERPRPGWRPACRAWPDPPLPGPCRRPGPVRGRTSRIFGRSSVRSCGATSGTRPCVAPCGHPTPILVERAGKHRSGRTGRHDAGRR